MLELIYIIFALPVVCAALAISGVLGSGSLLHWLNRLTAAAVGVAVILLAQSFTPTQPFNSEYVYLDALNVWVILIITALYVAEHGFPSHICCASTAVAILAVRLV